MKYTKKDLMPVQAFSIRRRFDEHDIFWTLAGGWYKAPLYEISEKQYVVPVPGAPDEVKPLAYYENEPNKMGDYIVHHHETLNNGRDEWTVKSWNCNAFVEFDNGLIALCGDIDYFIPVCLDEPEMEGEESVNKKQIKSIEIDYFPPMGSIKITHNMGKLPLGQHQIEDVLFELAEIAGYTATRKEPEIAPCPFCKSDNHDIGRDGVGYFYVTCYECEYQGPHKRSETEAIRLHNLIARRSD